MKMHFSRGTRPAFGPRSLLGLALILPSSLLLFPDPHHHPHTSASVMLAAKPHAVMSEKPGSDLSSSSAAVHPADAAAAAPRRSGVVGRLRDFYDKAMTQVALVGLICFMW